jgi:hypothetical protein
LLVAIFAGHGEVLEELHADPSLTEQELASLNAAIERAMLADTGTEVARAARCSVDRWLLAYREQFRILPATAQLRGPKGF